MKKLDFFCSSPSSTSICSSVDHRSMVRHGTRPIDHHHLHHHLYDTSKPNFSSCSSLSQLPINPKPNSPAKRSNFQRSKSSADYKYSAANYKRSDDNNNNNLRRKSSADVRDFEKTKATESSRYLLSDNVAYIDWISPSDALILDPHQNLYSKAKERRSSASISENVTPALKSSSSTRSHDQQVVVLWVSIHCKGCEGKVRKHISKMEGVTSFSIDMATKKVTVVGNVSPSSVVASVSKVKKALLWPSPTSSTPSPSLPWST
ncbi:protein SODIUM POTASSIUM ROOT DEFECTIVE 2-like [Mercurialis annua]|uniref:protein SODIUM POTASSIUM ROOT DEFECTIVE 2-like n=1 Tax=Mercurialis annua TaxID=3986 RepID=UPI0021601882|nr:protein SODIUM POTASSIUM ROOT DEFECTIVE 2-like [Mercurialis annua]